MNKIPDYKELIFQPDHIRAGNKFSIVGDSPSQKDIENGRCFSGDGAIAFAKTAARAGLDLSKANLHLALDFWPSGGDAMALLCTSKTKAASGGFTRYGDAWIPSKVLASITRLKASLEETRPQKILILGGFALYALFGYTSISSWRGSVLEYKLADGTVVPCVPTYHPSAVMRKPEWYVPQMRDLQRFLEEKFTMPGFNIKRGLSFDGYKAELQAIIAKLDAAPTKLAIDVETRLGYITVFGCAWSKTDALVVHFVEWDRANAFSVDEEVALVLLIRTILNHPNLIPIGQNYQYDIQYMVKLWGAKLRPYFDTMIEGHLLWNKGLELGLSFLASIYCEWYRYWKEDGKDFHTSWKNAEEQDIYWRYNGYDCCYTFEIFEAMEALLASGELPASLREPREFQYTMAVHVLRPVLDGIRFDSNLQRKMLLEMEERKAGYAAWFEYMIPNSLMEKGGASPWWDSPTKLSHFMYKQLQITPVLDKKTKKPTTGGDAPKLIGQREPLLKLICEKLDEYRSICLFINVFLKAKPAPEDGRMRTQYKLTGTDTFRLASSTDAFGYGLNLQNISKG